MLAPELLLVQYLVAQLVRQLGLFWGIYRPKGGRSWRRCNGSCQIERFRRNKKNFHDCKDELIDCGNVVESCGRVLGKSERELEEVQKIVIELDQTLYH